MKQLWIIAGMRRSGIHAVLNWLLSGLDAPYVVLNNVGHDRIKPKEENTMFSDGYNNLRSSNEQVVTVFEEKRLSTNTSKYSV